MSPLGILGGTFDPIHYGHLRSAWELLEVLALDQVCFVPAGTPPHRRMPRTSAELRLAMVRAAVAGEPRFNVDDRELYRDGPSYTVDTLTALRAEQGERSICLLLGMDAFLGLPGWHRWQALAELAHIVVVHRPGWDAGFDGELAELVRKRGQTDVAALHARPAGHVLLQPVTQLSISSSGIRELVAAGRDPRFLLPDSVREMMLESKCYTTQET
jgi:nicotinate-nucleotide adenylyltransferase